MGLKLHEDWGTTPAAIDNCLTVGDQYDIQVTLFNFCGERSIISIALGSELSPILPAKFNRLISTPIPWMNLDLWNTQLLRSETEQFMLTTGTIFNQPTPPHPIPNPPKKLEKLKVYLYPFGVRRPFNAIATSWPTLHWILVIRRPLDL